VYDLFGSVSLIRQVVEVIDTTLLTLMAVEIIYPIRVSIEAYAWCSEVFIIATLLAAIRRIPVLKIETAYMPEKFEVHMN
jgi:hypothetical protein